MMRAASWIALCLSLSLAASLARAASAPGWVEAGSSTIAPLCDSLSVFARHAEVESACRARLEELRVQPSPDSLEIAAVCRWLARAVGNQGRVKSDECLALASLSLSVRESRLGPTHPLVASSANTLGWVMEARGDHAAARRLYDRSLAISEASSVPDEVTLAETLQLLADLRTRLGDYPGTGDLYEHALALRERIYGPRNVKVALTLSSYAIYLKNVGELARSRAAYETCLSIQLETVGRDAPAVARTQYNLANVLSLTGEFAEAEAATRAAVDIGQRTLGFKHLDLARYRLGLAIVLARRHDLLPARDEAEEALAIQEAALPPGSPQLANGLGILASILRELGDMSQARPLMERALAIYEKDLGPDHPKVAEVLAELGRMHLGEGDSREAIRLLERALAIREKALGPDNLVVGYSLSELARLELLAGRDSAARAEASRSLTIQERQLGADSLGSSGALATLAEVDRRAGRIPEALAGITRALEVQARATGIRHPAYDMARRTETRILLDAGREGEALEIALEDMPRQRDLIRSMIRGLPERQALRYLGEFAPAQDLAFSVLVNTPGLRTRVGEVWSEVAQSRALVLDEMGLRQRALAREADADTARRRQADELAATTREMAWLLVSGPGDSPEGQGRERFLALQDRREHLERELAEAGGARESATTATAMSPAAMLEKLPPGSALVSYLRYRRIRPRGHEAGAASGGSASAPDDVNGEPSYLALVARPGGRDVTLVDLGPADELELRIARWRDEAGLGATVPGRAAGEADRLYREAGRRLREAAWDPFAGLLTGATHLFIVPDGELFLVDFATLPVGDDRFLVDEAYDLHTATTERDLLAGPGTVDPGRGLLAIGAPDFDLHVAGSAADTVKAAPLAASAAAASGSRATRGLLPSREDFARVTFAPLPGAAREIEEIVALWDEHPDASADTSLRLVGAEATEAAFKRLAPGRRVLHLASHGFFLGAERGASPEGTRGVGGVQPATASESPALLLDNPLLLSGIALAGANLRGRTLPGEEDGILTAAEVSALDLAGTEWAVVSSCASGLGETWAGEGVLGLRRAFQVAGAGTVIMSLWSVDDEIVRAWMSQLYRARWRENRSTPAAIQEASRRLLHDRRARGASTHPYYWSGFIASGSGH